MSRTTLNRIARRSITYLLPRITVADSIPVVSSFQSHARQISSSNYLEASSPFASGNSPTKKRKFLPRKAAVTLTDTARNFFKRLLAKPPRPEITGIMLYYDQSSTGEPRMVFRFGFVTKDEITDDDEAVSLELLEDGTPKPPKDSMNDGLPKLYVHHNAFLKVLGAKVDVNTKSIQPILYDREGNRMDPNA